MKQILYLSILKKNIPSVVSVFAGRIADTGIDPIPIMKKSLRIISENKKWFKEEFVMPFERGIRDYNTARQSAKNDYINLRKQNKDVVKEISKEVLPSN